MEAFEDGNEDAGRGDVPKRCPQGHPAVDRA